MSSTNNIQWEQFDTDKRTLNYRHKNIRFGYIGLSYTATQNVRYHYRLPGFQNDWSEPVKNREVTFNNLPPGSYTFEIYADAGTDESRSEMQSFAFTIKPAFWQTAWFLVACIALLVLSSAGIALYIQRRRNRELLEKLRAEKELNELRISSIRLKAIPHFNANILAAIEYYIANRTKEEVMHIVGIYSDFTFQTLSEVDKAARPLSEELAYVKMYLDLEKIRFMDKFDFRIEVEKDVNENVQLPNMILHTYCENAVKHGLMPLASGGLLTVHVSQHDEIVIVSVEDNGVGRTYAAQNRQTHSSKQGLSILNRQIEIYNRFNSEKISQHVEDLTRDGAPCGTLFTVEVPEEYNYIN
ncbi:MAG: histidine kinase [Tannerella sp.]|jgi:anti-sigma regulatory factor (Ser/Thr protein kinase)|nr:histidine kinase [Tannerella sp.]